MKQLISPLRILSFVLLSLLAYTSCSDDDNTSSTSASHFLGGWYLDWSTSEKINWNEMNFYADGTFNYCTITSSMKEDVNIKEEGKSTYTYDGKVISCLYNWTTGNASTEKLQINYLDKYTCILENITYGLEEAYSRIVDTYYLNVGDATKFVFNDPEFQANSYTSANTKIAQVTETGEITAIKRGTTYITARAEVGSVTIKVVVTDQNFATDEFSNDLTLSKREIIKKYGKDYMELPDLNGLLYYPGERDINELMFKFDKTGKVTEVMVGYWPGSDFQKINQSFNRKYKHIGIEENGYNVYLASNEKCNYYASVDIQMSMVSYTKKINDFEKYDLGILGTADELAQLLGYELTEEDDGYFATALKGGDTYEAATVMYDTETKMPQMIVFTCKENVSEDYMQNLVKERYPDYHEKFGFCNQTEWSTTGKIVFVSVTTNKRNRVQVTYLLP